jgi:aryl-alcohol dehydrogenase-like predicted oxidoreductase
MGLLEALSYFANRGEVVITTRVRGKMHDGPYGAGLSRKAIPSEIGRSPKRIGTDYSRRERRALG